MIYLDVVVPKSLERAVSESNSSFNNIVPNLADVPIPLSSLLKIFGIRGSVPFKIKIPKNQQDNPMFELIQPHLVEIRYFLAYMRSKYKSNGGEYPIIYFPR